MSDSANVWNPKDPVATISNYSSVVTQRFVATSGQITFNIDNFAYVPGTKSLLIYKDGALLSPEVDVIETDGDTFTLTLAATTGQIIDAVGFIGSINAVVDPYYLGPKAAAPSVDNQGVTLGSSQEGYSYWNTTSDDWWMWTGSVWQSQRSSANLVSIADAGGYYTGTDVEAALQEIQADIRSTSTGKGASIIGLEDVGSFYTTTTVEAALAENRPAAKGTVEANKDVTASSTGKVIYPSGTQLQVDGKSTALVAAASSITLSSLSFPAGRTIEVEAHLIGVTGIIAYYLELNSDSTNTNYYSTVIDNGAIYSSAGVNLPFLYDIDAGDEVFFKITLSPNITSGEIFVTAEMCMNDVSGVLHSIASVIRYTVSDVITSVGIRTSTGVNYIDVGSTLRVRLK